MNKFLEDLKTGKEKICVVGLGYVGLPLAVSLAEHFKVVGFDKTTRKKLSKELKILELKRLLRNGRRFWDEENLESGCRKHHFSAFSFIRV
ncbi:hypothetical protein THERU_04035 [Thermocrinis ruber]|uniref:UDP-glucose/GDP-mannose dehydrogenase N-terminal domain-containing protein n=1 Tax=Thermocrinis ruber TaxID=75906 RepID=W0DEN1_9AQUI|nr:hypothetical protein [Thermocrinis ruber]AHE96801.1 hypothetical protein THERU_04035 [Thermocrinis ruber]